MDIEPCCLTANGKIENSIPHEDFGENPEQSLHKLRKQDPKIPREKNHLSVQKTLLITHDNRIEIGYVTKISLRHMRNEYMNKFIPY